MVKYQTVRIPIFRGRVDLFIADSFPEIEIYIKENNLENKLNYSDDTEGVCLVSGNVVTIGLINCNKLLRNFVHESLHATCEIIDYYGGDISSRNQETIAYIQSYLIDEFLNLITNEK